MRIEIPEIEFTYNDIFKTQELQGVNCEDHSNHGLTV